MASAIAELLMKRRVTDTSEIAALNATLLAGLERYLKALLKHRQKQEELALRRALQAENERSNICYPRRYPEGSVDT